MYSNSGSRRLDILDDSMTVMTRSDIVRFEDIPPASFDDQKH